MVLKSFRYFARASPGDNLYGEDDLARTEVDHWLSFSLGPLSCRASGFSDGIQYLDAEVFGKDPTFAERLLVRGRLTAADFAVFGALFTNGQWQVHWCQFIKWQFTAHSCIIFRAS